MVDIRAGDSSTWYGIKMSSPALDADAFFLPDVKVQNLKLKYLCQ